jgi:hypothetical protein
VQSSAAPLLGLAAGSPEAAFVNVETLEPWSGHLKYAAGVSSPITAVEAFAYSSFFGEGQLLVAVRLEPVTELEEAGAAEFMILLADVKTSCTFSMAACSDLFHGKSTAQMDMQDYQVVATHMLPHQSLHVTLWARPAGGGFCLEHIGLLWNECQHKSLEAFSKTKPGLDWHEKVAAALTGRADAFPGLGACQVQHAMLVQQRRPHEALQLSFVVFFGYSQVVGKLWSCRVRHLYKQSQPSTLISKLDVGDRVYGILYAEWRQVGSGMHHVLQVTSKLTEQMPLLAVQLGTAAEAPPQDIGKHPASYWSELWKMEDMKLHKRRHWQAYRCDCGEIQVIDDDGDAENCGMVEVEKIVEKTFQKLEGFEADKVKSEVLKELLNEQRRPILTTGAKKTRKKSEAVECSFMDPYAAICKRQRDLLEAGEKQAALLKEATLQSKEKGCDRGSSGNVACGEREASAHNSSCHVAGGKKWQKWGESWDWKSQNSWKRWRPQQDWKEGWTDLPSKKQRTMSPPPPPRQLREVAHGPPLPPFFGANSLHAGLGPLKLFRSILEKESVAFVGRQNEFEVCEGGGGLLPNSSSLQQKLTPKLQV